DIGNEALLQIRQAGKLVDLRQPLAVGVLIERADRQRHLRGWLPERFDLPTADIDRVDTFGADQGIVDVARILARESAETERQRVAGLEIPRGAQVVTGPLAVVHGVRADFDAAAVAVESGIERHVFDQAADAARAIQRALRPTKHFDAADITRVDI